MPSTVQSTFLNKAVNIHSLKPLIVSKVISKGMEDKIAGSGITLSRLKLSILRGGKEGLRSVLTEKVNGKPRVTTTSRIIAAQRLRPVTRILSGGGGGGGANEAKVDQNTEMYFLLSDTFI